MLNKVGNRNISTTEEYNINKFQDSNSSILYDNSQNSKIPQTEEYKITKECINTDKHQNSNGSILYSNCSILEQQKIEEVKTQNILIHKDIDKENIIYPDIEFATIDSNNSQNMYQITWEKIKPSISSCMFSRKLLLVSLMKEHTNILINKIADFVIFSGIKDGTEIIANSLTSNKRAVQQELKPYLVIFQEHDVTDLSFTVFEGTNIIKQVHWKKHFDTNEIVIDLLNEKSEKTIIHNVKTFSIYEITKHNKINTIIKNGIYQNLPQSPLADLYIIIRQHQFLLFFKNFKLIHSIKSISYVFEKINIDGSLFCRKENDEKHIMKLSPMGEIDYIEISGITDYPKVGNFKLIDKDGYINIYFFYHESLAFHIIDEYTKNADYKEILPNKFDDDITTINYLVKYKKDRYADILFLFFTLNCRKGYHSTFENGLYGNKLQNDLCAGNAIYNIPYIDYYKGLEGEYKYLNTISQAWLTKEQKNNFKMYVEKIYNKYELQVNYECLPEIFTNGLISADAMLDELESYINMLVEQNYIEIDYRNKFIYNDKHSLILDYKAKKQEIISQITLSGKYNKKWKSEVELYSLVAKFFPDAIYQYHSEILNKQSFDIFIPSLNIAIEYQGIQHYEVVDIFGGLEGLQKRIQLDKQKRLICKKNNIDLIEWKYDLPINSLNLKKILNKTNNHYNFKELQE